MGPGVAHVNSFLIQLGGPWHSSADGYPSFMPQAPHTRNSSLMSRPIQQRGRQRNSNKTQKNTHPAEDNFFVVVVGKAREPQYGQRKPVRRAGRSSSSSRKS